MIMRSTDEQMMEITARAAEMKKEQKLRKAIAAEALSCCVCTALLIWCAAAMPSFEVAIRDSAKNYYGGLLLSSPALGYVVMSILGFLLGICITLLCLHLHNQDREGDVRK